MFHIARPGVSRHLRVLREHGVVTVRAEGQHRVYSLRPESISQVEQWCAEVTGYWTNRLDSLETEIARGKRVRKGKAEMTDLLGVLRDTPDGASVSFDRAFKTDPNDLWDAVTDPARLERWFAKVDGELTERGHFTIHFDDGDVPRCHLIECNPKRQFAFEWPQATETLVTVTVLPDGKHSRLELRHDRLTKTSAPEYAAGWDAYFHTLADYLAGKEGGDWWAKFNETKAAYRAQMPL